jgi:thioredoxin:protein disulfide reductase
MLKQIIIAALLLPFLSFATTTPLTPDKAFKLSAQTKDQQTVVLHLDIAPGYHIYSSTLMIQTQNKTNIDNIILPPPTWVHDKKTGSYQSYSGKIKIGLAFLHLKQNKLNLLVAYSGCSDSGFCYPMQKMLLTVPMHKFPSKIIMAQQAPPNQPMHLSSQKISILSTIITFLGLGVLIAFSPCILPTLPILYATITLGKQRKSTLKTITLALSYILGMTISFTAAGIAIGLLGHSIQAQLQSSIMIIGMSALILLLAASSFDLVHFKTPKILQRKHAHKNINSTAEASISKSFCMGAFSSLVVSPCATPALIGVLAFIADKGSAITGAYSLFALGIGMGIPLLLISVLGNRLTPKSGPWMQRIKHIIGFMLVALAIWLLERILSDKIHLLLWSIWAVASGIILGGFKTPTKYLYARLRFLLCWILILLGVVWFAGFINNKTSLLYPIHSLQTRVDFSAVKNMAQLDKILSSQKTPTQTYMLYFTANWCASCQWMDAYLFTKSAVVNSLKKYKVLKIDVSQQTAGQLKIMRKYKVIAPPTFIFIKNNKELSDSRIIGDSSASSFLKKIKAINPMPAEQPAAQDFSVAGTTSADATDFLAKLQSAVAKNNKQDAAKLVQFPLRINQHGKSSFVKSKAEFVANYRTIFTNKIQQVISKQQVQSLFVNSQGVMLGNGEVWARPADPAKSQALKIIVINH